MSAISNGNSNSAMDQTVAERFDALLAAIHASADDWRRRTNEALSDRDDMGAQECLAAVQQITEAAGEVETVYQMWKGRWPVRAASPRTGQSVRPHTKHLGEKLRVSLSSKVFEYPTAAETFARTLEEIGIEQVARLDKTLSGIPLIAMSKVPTYQQQFAIGQFYVCTHSNTREKKHLLEEIAAELGVALSVEIISK